MGDDNNQQIDIFISKLIIKTPSGALFLYSIELGYEGLYIIWDLIK